MASEVLVMAKSYMYRGFRIRYAEGLGYTADNGKSPLIGGCSRAETQDAIDEWIADNETCPRDKSGWLLVSGLVSAMAVFLAVFAFFGVW
jgi:hypothetical protein